MSRLYPLFLKLEGRRVLIVGGGKVALQKWRTLHGTGAVLTVVAPRIHPRIEDNPDGPGPRARLLRRAFRPADLEGAQLVFAATDDPAVNREVYRLAARAGVTANAVDDPHHCDFYTPAVFRRDDLTLAVSTAGRFPGLGKALREALEALLPEGHGPLLGQLLALRDAARGAAPARAERAEALRDLLERFKRDYLGSAALPEFDRHGGHAYSRHAAGPAGSAALATEPISQER